MRRQVRATFLGIAAASALAACASNPSKAPLAVASSDYQQVATNAVRSTLICKREYLTGSHVKFVDVCLTQAQIQAQRDRGRQMLDDARRVPGEQPSIQPDGSVKWPANSGMQAW
jgi:hypothetical protein